MFNIEYTSKWDTLAGRRRTLSVAKYFFSVTIRICLIYLLNSMQIKNFYLLCKVGKSLGSEV